MASSPPNRGWLLAVLLAMLFMYQADATIVNVAAPSIHADLGASGAQLELVIGGYLLASAALIITGARLGHTHGYRGVFTTSLQIAGAIGVAAFGTLYLSQVTRPGAPPATRAFGIVTATFALVTLIAGAAVYRATHHPAARPGSTGPAPGHPASALRRRQAV